ncbi:hypothetical protein D3C80_1719660 [compost metagenome]
MVFDQDDSAADDGCFGQDCVKFSSCEAQHSEFLQAVRRNATHAGRIPSTEMERCFNGAGLREADV